MRTVAFLCVLCASMANLSLADKKYVLKPDSPAEKALLEARAEADPSKRLALLDAFVRSFPESAGAAYAQYLSNYLELKEWDKALEYGRKAYDADNEEPEILANLTRAALGQGDSGAAVQWGTAGGALLRKLSAAPRPDNVDEDEWKRHQEELQTQREQLEYFTFEAVSREADAARRIQLLDQFTQAFPGGTYARRAPAAYALAYQQTGDAAKMVAHAEKALELEPDHEAMHLLLGETYLQQNRLDQARQHAQSVTKILEAKTRPETMSEAEWTKYLNNYRGAAQSIVGRVLMQQDKTAAALPVLKSAADLLAGDPQALAPVLYNLGFAYAKQNRLTEARAVLSRAARIPGPYQQLSRALLAKVK